MKLLNLDSSLQARKELAQELHYSGDMNDSATMNIWLHKQVIQKIIDNGGQLPRVVMPSALPTEGSRSPRGADPARRPAGCCHSVSSQNSSRRSSRIVGVRP